MVCTTCTKGVLGPLHALLSILRRLCAQTPARQQAGVCSKPHMEGPEKGAADSNAAKILQLPDLLRRLSAHTHALQQAGLCSKPHMEGPENEAADSNAADISQLPDLALELIFNAQLPNLARPACVCSLHLEDRDATSRCISDT